ncbi:hypothetical protein NQZ68_031711 [Dissostichus eleginoides]|nr:hypothetical protein NQZ68_031711 [Dissostichus eleginoides]
MAFSQTPLDVFNPPKSVQRNVERWSRRLSEDVGYVLQAYLSGGRELSVSITPPVPFYQSPVGTASQSGQACPLLCPRTG